MLRIEICSALVDKIEGVIFRPPFTHVLLLPTNSGADVKDLDESEAIIDGSSDVL